MKTSTDYSQGPSFVRAASWKALATYFSLAFLWTWAFLFPAVRVFDEPFQTLLIILGAFGPFLSAVVTLRIYEGGDSLKNWLRCIFRFKVPAGWYLAGAFFIPALIGSLHFLIYRLLGGAPSFELAAPWYQYLAFLIPTALLTGGNEEPGWRGFALPVLNKLTNPLAAGLILGVVHALWHLPLMGHYGTTILWYIFGLIPLTFLFNWFYLHSRGSIWPVMLFHSGTNVIGSFIPAPETVLHGSIDFVILRGLVYWLMAVILVILTRKFWFQPRSSA